jgi:hypothetical protein
MADLYLPERTQLPNNIGGVKPPMELADQSGIQSFGRSIEQIGGYTADRLIGMRAANEYHDFEGEAKTAEIELDSFIRNNPYATEQQLKAQRDIMLKKIETAAGKLTTRRAKQWAKEGYLSQKKAITARADGIIQGVIQEQELTKSQAIRDDFIAKGDYEGLKNYWSDAVQSGLYGDVSLELDEDGNPKNDSIVTLLYKEDARKTLVNLQKAQKEQVEAQVKDALIAAVGEEGNKEAGYRVLDQFYKNKVITAEENKLYGDWMDNYVAGRFKRAAEAQKQTTRQIYGDLSQKIVGGNLTYDDIELSKLDKDDKLLWQSYIAGSYADSPKETVYKGYDRVIEAIVKSNSLEMSPKDAYDLILKARFVDRSITDEQFQEAARRIENPYPKPVLVNLRAALNDNKNQFHGIYKSKADEKKEIEVNTALLAWVDEQLEQKKTPTRKEMYAMSSQFRLTSPTIYEIGSTIETGNRKWEVVGYDTDGEPLVEEVK